MRKFNGTKQFVTFSNGYVAWLEKENTRLEKENTRLLEACKLADPALRESLVVGSPLCREALEKVRAAIAAEESEVNDADHKKPTARA